MGWTWPFRFGARDETQDIEHQAILDALSPGWDISAGTDLYDETMVDALAITMIWLVNKRIGNQNFPRRMLESLPVWEQACDLRPSVDDLDVDRRARVAAKLRGIAGNSLFDLEAAAEEILGNNFDGLVVVDPDNWITYWPGLNPGPPGYEFSSNRATIGIRMIKTGLPEAVFRARRDDVADAIDQMRPAWMTYVIGVGSDFVLNVGVVGQTVIA